MDNQSDQSPPRFPSWRGGGGGGRDDFPEVGGRAKPADQEGVAASARAAGRAVTRVRGAGPCPPGPGSGGAGVRRARRGPRGAREARGRARAGRAGRSPRSRAEADVVRVRRASPRRLRPREPSPPEAAEHAPGARQQARAGPADVAEGRQRLRVRPEVVRGPGRRGLCHPVPPCAPATFPVSPGTR